MEDLWIGVFETFSDIFRYDMYCGIMKQHGYYLEKYS